MAQFLGFFFLCFVLLCGSDALTAQSLAFPGAEGYGKYTTGGRGGRVIYVTNLNDSGEGSLRAVVKEKGTRIIIFKVSGNIFLQSPLTIKEGNVTIAGQSAPGGGICVCNFPMKVAADNVIIRFMRFRPGDLMKSESDALSGNKHKDIIIDHCSMSWSVDEASSFYDNSNFTMQWCIISESFYNSSHKKGEHGYGGIWGGQKASFHHNLLSDHTSRNPRFCGSRFSKNPDAEQVDMRNNVIYNWGFNTVYGGEGASQNIVNNYYKPGPATSDKVRSRILNLTTFFYDASVRPDTVPAGKFYIAGNYVEGDVKASADNWKYGVQGKNLNDEIKSRSRLDKPIDGDGISTQSAQEAYALVLKYAGAILPRRDSVDLRITEEVRTGNEKFGGAFDQKAGRTSGIIDTQSTVGGWPVLQQETPPPDSDSDGMPDAWEKQNKLNPGDPSDASAFTMDKAYSNIEVYLNSLVPEMK